MSLLRSALADKPLTKIKLESEEYPCPTNMIKLCIIIFLALRLYKELILVFRLFLFLVSFNSWTCIFSNHSEIDGTFNVC